MMYGQTGQAAGYYAGTNFGSVVGYAAPFVPLAPRPKQFVQKPFPLPPPPPAPAMTVESTNAGGGKDITFPGTIISSETETFPGSQTFTSQDKGLTIGPVVPATLDQLQQAQAYSSASIMKPSTYPELFGSKVFGMTPTYNKATGQVRATAPNVGLLGGGMLSPFIGLGSAMMQNKVETAALNAAMGEKGNGVFTLNGMTIALVDGKISGNIKALEDQGYSYQQINNFVNNYAEQQGDPTKFGGRYTEARVGVERTASSPQAYGTPTQTYSSSELGFGTTGSMSEAGRPTGFVSGSRGGDFGTGSHGGEKGGNVSGSMGGDFGTGGHGGEKAYGGTIGFAAGGLPQAEQAVAQQQSGLSAPAGFIDGEPENFSPEKTVADDKPISVPEGSFIINAPAVEVAGSQDIKQMLMEAYTELGKRVDKAPSNTKILTEEEVDILISSGEVVVPPELAGIIGYDRLRKINNRGKDEVARRQAEAEGGNEQGFAMGDLVTSGGFIPGIRQKPDVSLSDIPRGEQGFMYQQNIPDMPLPTLLDDTFFNYRFGDIKNAIQEVEIKGYEDNPYIFTGVRRKGAASSAFGPMQITASTLKDFKERSPDYKFLKPDEKEYIDMLIQQGDDKVNVEKYGGIYRDGKKQPTSKELKSKLTPYGTGTIPAEMHEQYYDDVSNLVLRQKLQDHDSLESALSSYGEGQKYANKVMSGLK